MVNKKAKHKTITFNKPEPIDFDDNETENTRAPQASVYFYHSDHLGTASIITDISGLPHQFFLNLPFGEEMAAQHSTTTDFYSRYKFNGKELDKETGYYYYGARYYEPSVSQWLSVDPLVEKYSGYSPYNYTLDNPVMLIDPDGRSVGDCCGLTVLINILQKEFKKDISEGVDYIKEHGIIEASITPSVGFQAGFSTPYGRFEGGVSTTKGNTYAVTLNNETDSSNLIKVKETNLKLHNYFGGNIGVKGAAAFGGKIDIVTKAPENPKDVKDMIITDFDHLDWEINAGPKTTNNSDTPKYDISKPKLSTKAVMGNNFMGIRTSIGYKMILGVVIKVKIGLE